jgi:hypothetical protein
MATDGISGNNAPIRQAPAPAPAGVDASTGTVAGAPAPAAGGAMAVAASDPSQASQASQALLAALQAQLSQSLGDLAALATKPALAAPDPQATKLSPSQWDTLLSALGNPPNASGDVSADIEVLNAQTSQQSIQALASGIKSDQARSKKVSDARISQIEQSTKSAIEAAKTEGSWYSKLFNWVGKALSAAASVLTAVAGAVMIATGAGAPLGTFLLAYGAMGVANSVLDLVNTIRADQGKPPLLGGMTLSFGGLIAKGLEAAGVEKQTAQLIGLGAEVIVALSTVAFTGGASLVKLGELASRGIKALSIMQRVTTVSSAMTTVGNAAVQVQVADLKKDAADADVKAEKLKGQVNLLMKQIAADTDLVKTLTQVVQDSFDRASQAVKNTRDVNIGTASAMRLSA